MIIRHHHCKQCGYIFCGKCSATVCSTDLYSTEVKSGKIRVCTACSTKTLLVRRKPRQIRKPSKSIVSKTLKFEVWDENTFIDPNVPELPVSTGSELQKRSVIQDLAEKRVNRQEISENSCLLTKSPLRSRLQNHLTDVKEEEDESMNNVGVLCILPQSVYNFIFGD